MTGVASVLEQASQPKPRLARSDHGSPFVASPLRFILYPWVFILFITLVGAALRFMYLSSPPIWGDEAKTFGRICGTFQQLLDTVSNTDFSPLHYMLYWAIAQTTAMTPFMMRIAPAIAGTLMIPAMYFLAVQIVSRPTAMLAATFTACSAFMLNYSRDAKMYAECWLFTTLSMAFLLCWLRRRSRFAWYSWVFCTMAMLGLQLVAAITLVIQAIVFLSHRRLHWKPAIFFVLGLAVGITPVIIHTRHFNKYAERVEEGGRLSAGTQWVEAYNRGRDGLDLNRYAASAFLYGWEWPRPVDEPQIRERTLKLLKGAGIALCIFIFLGIFPWRDFHPLRRSNRADPAAPGAESWWRSVLWLGTWMALPAYAIYRASLTNAVPPWHWLQAIAEFFAQHSVLSTLIFPALLLLLLLRGHTLRHRLVNSLLLCIIASVIFGICCIAYIYTPPQPGSVWIPRYLGIAWPAFAITVCALLMRLPLKRIRHTAIALLLAVNLIQHGARVFAGSEPPTDRMAADAIRSADDPGTRACFALNVDNYLHGAHPAGGVMGEPGSGVIGSQMARYYLAIQSGRTPQPKEMLPVRSAWDNAFRIWTITMTPEAVIPNFNKQLSQVKTLIVWDRLEPGVVESVDRLSAKLSPDWKRTDEQLYPARDHWTWRDLFTARRRVYTRQPATQPTTLPAAR